jgi:O-antigen/teichoic acid export membrane protein
MSAETVVPAPRPGALSERLVALRDPMARNSIALAASVVVASGFGFVFWVLAARWFTADQVGPVSALFGLVGLASSLATCGLPETMVRFLRSTSDQLGLVRRAVTATVIVGAVLGASVALVWQTGDEPISGSVTAVVALVALAVVASAATNVADNAVVAVGKPAFLLVESTIAGVAKLAFLGAAVALGAGSFGMAMSLAGAVAVGGVAIGASIRYAVPLRRDLASPARLGTHRGFSTVNWLGGAASMVPAALAGTIAVARIDAAAGAFIGIPLLMLGAMNIIPSSAARTLLAEAGRTPQELWELARRSMRMTASLLVPVTAGIALAAPLLLSVFGHDYADHSAGALRWLCLASLVGSLNYLGDVVLNVRVDRLEYLFANVCGSVSVLLGALIGAGHGVTGIGAGWAVGQLGYAAVVWSMVALRPFSRNKEQSA